MKKHPCEQLHRTIASTTRAIFADLDDEQLIDLLQLLGRSGPDANAALAAIAASPVQAAEAIHAGATLAIATEAERRRTARHAARHN